MVPRVNYPDKVNTPDYLINDKRFDLKEITGNSKNTIDQNCRKAKKQYIDLLLKTDVHAPGELRANIQPRNLEDFYKAFDIKEGDKMFMPVDKRVNIW